MEDLKINGTWAINHIEKEKTRNVELPKERNIKFPSMSLRREIIPDSLITSERGNKKAKVTSLVRRKNRNVKPVRGCRIKFRCGYTLRTRSRRELWKRRWSYVALESWRREVGEWVDMGTRYIYSRNKTFES